MIEVSKIDNLLKTIKRMHSIIENQDVEKQIESQENLGDLLRKR